MTSPQPLCYNCHKPLEVSPPYFCSSACKATYWHESELSQETRPAKDIKEIQRLLLEKAAKGREEQAKINRQNLHKELNQQYKGEGDPADFFEGLVEN